MGNLGGLEIVMILVVALIVLGPAKLPEAARQVGKAVTELRRISGGFQREFREAIQDPIIEAEARARGAAESAKKAIVEPFTNPSAPIDSPSADNQTPKPDSDASADD